MTSEQSSLSNTSLPSSAGQNLFLQALGGLLTVLQKVFLPHLAAGMGLFIMTAYVTYSFLIQPLHLPKTMEWGMVFLVLGVYALFFFLYSFVTANIFALRSACAVWDNFIDDMLELIKERVTSKIANMSEGIAKEQAKVVVAGSISEVAGIFSNYERKSWLRWISAVLLGIVTFAMRSVLLARIIKISGKTVQLGKIFAGRAALVGAVFLNLRLFSTLLLWFLYAAGVLMVLINFLFVFWLK